MRQKTSLTIVEKAKIAVPGFDKVAAKLEQQVELAISVYGCHPFRSMGATLKDPAMLIKKSLVIPHYIFSHGLSLEVNTV